MSLRFPAKPGDPLLNGGDSAHFEYVRPESVTDDVKFLEPAIVF